MKCDYIDVKEIKKNLREAIRQSGLTQTEIAKRMNVTQSCIAHYVKGDKMPAIDTLANLCLILDVSPAFILCYPEQDLQIPDRNKTY